MVVKGTTSAFGLEAEKNKMKKCLLIMLLIVSTSVFAQNEVTRFLGIPVDGYKSEMIQKLKGKGFKYNSTKDCLEGEFNGNEVEISVVTNNNKVYRIAVFDKYYSNESDIKIKFNKLCSQFENNSKYIGSSEQKISEKEDISIQMSLYSKRYEAVFFQKNTDGKIDEDGFNRPVWFMIDEQYGRYRILMFYDNGFNQSNGDDL